MPSFVFVLLLSSSIPSIPHNYFKRCLISCCLFSFYALFLPTSFNFSSHQFFTTSLLLFFLLLLATQFRSSNFFVLCSSFYPSFPSISFPSAVSVCTVIIRHSFLPSSVLLFAVCKCIFFTLFLLYSFIVPLLYSVISRQHINRVI